MSVFDKLYQLANPTTFWSEAADSTLEERALPVPTQVGTVSSGNTHGGLVDLHRWSSPPKKGEYDLISAYTDSPPFRSVVNRVNTSFGGIQFFSVDDDGRQDFTHPAIKLLDNYNPQMRGSQGRELEQLYVDVPGDAVTIVCPSATERKVELYPVPPNWVTMDTYKGEERYIVSMGGMEYEFGPEYIIHQKEINPFDPYGRGKGTGWAAADEITADEQVAKHVTSYYYNSTRPEFIGVLKGASAEQIKTFEKDWDNKYRGFRRHWRPAWLSAEVDIHDMTQKLVGEDIRMLRDLHLEMIQWLYGVPPEVLGRVTNSNRATIKEAKEMMGTYVLDPRARRRKCLWQFVADQLWPGTEIGYVSPIPREFDRRDEIMSRHPYAFTVNDIRQEAGYDPVPDGDVYPVPTNIELVSQTGRTMRQIRGSEPVIRLLDHDAAAE